MKLNLCYVDPIYFIEHKLYNHASNKNSAYFNMFEEEFDDEYIVSIPISDYPEYIASGQYSETLYYDVCKNDDGEYHIMMICNIGIDNGLAGTTLSVSMIFDDKVEHDDYAARLFIIEYTDLDNPGKLLDNKIIYFDNMVELLALIKNESKIYARTESPLITITE